MELEEAKWYRGNVKNGHQHWTYLNRHSKAHNGKGCHTTRGERIIYRNRRIVVQQYIATQHRRRHTATQQNYKRNRKYKHRQSVLTLR